MPTTAPTSATDTSPPLSLTCSTQQLLEIIGVVTSNITFPFKNTNLTGIFSPSGVAPPNTNVGNPNSNWLAFPDNATNQYLASQLYVDCNNTVPGSIVFSFANQPPFTSNNPIPADGPFGSGVSALSTMQLCEAIAVLTKELARPYPFYNQTGLFLNGANNLQFPDTAYNQQVGFNINPYTDGVFIYVPTFVGWPTSGL